MNFNASKILIRYFKYSKPLIVIAIFSITYLLLFPCHIFPNIPPRVIKGNLDLSEFCLNEEKTIKLNGEWEFYWGQFLSANEYKVRKFHPLENKKYIQFPSNWNDFGYPGKGYATYILNIKLPDSLNKCALKVFTFGTAGEIFINGKSAYKTGVTGIDKINSHPAYNPQIIPLDLGQNVSEIEVLLHISNFHHRKGGSWREIELGTFKELDKRHENELIKIYFLIGAIFIMGLYHLGLFYFRRKDKTPLYFAFFCLSIAVRSLTTGNYFYNVFIELPWDILLKIEYLSTFFAFMSFVKFIQHLFPNLTNKIFMTSNMAAGGIFCCTVLFFQTYIFSHLIVPFQILIIIGVFYCFFVLVKAIVRKVEGALLLFFGMIGLFIIVINDMLHNNSMIQTGNYMSQGLFFFILIQSYLLSTRFAKAFSLSERLSEELTKINANLENIVEIRTQKVEDQKKELQKQAQELETAYIELKKLDSFKEGLIGMVVHDLKNPLGALINLTEGDLFSSPDEYNILLKQIHDYSMQMLQMVSNILDVQKYEHSKIELNNKNINLLEITTKVIQQIEYLRKEKNIKILNHINPKINIMADVYFTGRIFTNLLSNAIKYSPPSKMIILNAQSSTGMFENPKFIKILVIDSGPGIPHSESEKIFTKFGQVSAKKSGNIRSTGLGLAFCKIAVEAHGGEIGVLPGEKNGSTFWFTLPLSPIDFNSNKIDFEPITHKATGFNMVSLSALSEDDKKLLSFTISRVDQFEVYEVSSICEILQSLDNVNDTIKTWRNELQEALYTSDEIKFRNLLKIEF